MSQPNPEYSLLHGDAAFLASVDDFKAAQSRLVGQTLAPVQESAEWEAIYQQTVCDLDARELALDPTFDYPALPFEDEMPDVQHDFKYPEPRWGVNLPSQSIVRTVRPTKDELGRPYLTRDAAGYARHVWEGVFAPFDPPKVDGRKALATAVAAAALVAGSNFDTADKSQELAMPAEQRTETTDGLLVRYTEEQAIVTLPTLEGQDAQQSITDAANATQIAIEDQEVRGDEYLLPSSASREQIQAAVIAFMAPDNASAPAETDTSTTQTAQIAAGERPKDVFASQRDNGEWGVRPNGKVIDRTNTCNLTSLSMALDKIGLLPPAPEGKQPEQLLADVFLEKHAPAGRDITYFDTLARIARDFGAKASVGKLANTRQEWMQIKEQLGKGRAGIMSISGHIVHLNDVTEEGLVVDDPVGDTVLLHQTPEGWRSSVHPDYRDSSGNPWYGFLSLSDRTPSQPNQPGQPGDNHVIPWSDVDQYAHFGHLLMISPGSQETPQAQPAQAEANVPAEQRYQQAMDALLTEIASHEGGWDSVNTGVAGDTKLGGNKYQQLFDGRMLSQLTLQEVLDMQTQDRLFAVGRYQFIPATLASAVQATGIDTGRLFDSATQNQLAVDYLILGGKRTNLRDYLTGKSDNMDAAINDAAKEWASLPSTDGTGFYDGDSAGNNAAGGMQRVEHMKRLLGDIRAAYLAKQQPAPAAPEPTPQTSGRRNVVALGDSLMVGMQKYGGLEAKDEAHNLNVIAVSAKGGRSLEAGPTTGLQALNSVLPQVAQSEIVVLGFGTNAHGNSQQYEQALRQAIEQIGPDKTIVIPRITAETNSRDERNAIIERVAKETGAHVVDYGDVIQLGGDRIHASNYADVAEDLLGDIAALPAQEPVTELEEVAVLATTTTTTPTEPAAQEVTRQEYLGSGLFVDEAQAKHIYEPYFRGAERRVDLEALAEWVESLPQVTNSDGNVRYEIRIDNVPEMAKGDR